MNCEMCGKEGPVAPTRVEGSTLQLCDKCGKYGQVLARPSVPINKKSISRTAEPSLGIVTDYAARIRKARERAGLTQKDFAMKLNEKESVIHNLEASHLEPPLDLARKLEKLLRITLIEEEQGGVVTAAKTENRGLTIGDLLKK